ncbi:hypothetical protein [Bdellovibrio bacteriovorus]|uniref:Uncharacterized protein n=1 Tax=Bdellovibrio bacteriovorus TaxID=959 RepID=A0A1Z3N7T7_BDEBC|nr:hypothetical protein [Bdellovibrio bacteriovorus]ASD63540.1 hypothetical protein B9G79_08125 [Bdellovibrio bacteriovorus]
MKNLNNHGLTAVELVIGVGLVAILTSVVVTTQLTVTKDQVKMTKELEDSIDTKLAERILFSDFNNVDPSYNNLTVKDDSGKMFFDYYPDVPANAIKNGLERNATLSLTGRKEFVIMTQDPAAGGVLVYDPVFAYEVGPAPDDFNVAASLTFKGLNYNDKVASQRPAMWNTGRTVMLDTPARLRPLVNGVANMQVAPRSPIYVGTVHGISTVSDSNISTYVNMNHPETGEHLASADLFLRRAPSIGGGQSLIRLRAVHLIKYYLEEMKETGSTQRMARLYKVSYAEGRWGTPVLLADRVEKLSLRRDSILKRMIYFKVKKVDTTKTASL